MMHGLFSLMLVSLIHLLRIFHKLILNAACSIALTISHCIACSPNLHGVYRNISSGAWFFWYVRLVLLINLLYWNIGRAKSILSFVCHMWFGFIPG